MPQPTDDERMERLAELMQSGDASGFENDDLEEIARLLGQTDPFVDPPPAPHDLTPSLFARALSLFWRPR